MKVWKRFPVVKFAANCGIFLVNFVLAFTVMPWVFFYKVANGRIDFVKVREDRVFFVLALALAWAQWTMAFIAILRWMEPQLFQ